VSKFCSVAKLAVLNTLSAAGQYKKWCPLKGVNWMVLTGCMEYEMETIFCRNVSCMGLPILLGTTLSLSQILQCLYIKLNPLWPRLFHKNPQKFSSVTM